MLFVVLFLVVFGGGGGFLYYYQTKGKANREAKKKQKALDAIPDYDVGNAAISNQMTGAYGMSNIQAHRQTLYNDAMGNGGAYGGGGNPMMYNGAAMGGTIGGGVRSENSFERNRLSCFPVRNSSFSKQMVGMTSPQNTYMRA
jgi:hypothetical protein